MHFPCANYHRMGFMCARMCMLVHNYLYPINLFYIDRSKVNMINSTTNHIWPISLAMI